MIIDTRITMDQNLTKRILDRMESTISRDSGTKMEILWQRRVWYPLHRLLSVGSLLHRTFKKFLLTVFHTTLFFICTLFMYTLC